MNRSSIARSRPLDETSLPLSDTQRSQLLSKIEHATHYLPNQGPLSSFVHHNTLHSLQKLSFDEAVIQGGKLFGCEPYLPEFRYREELQRGRISLDDLRQLLMDDLGEKADGLIAAFGTRYTLRLAMLQMPLYSLPHGELTWLLAETDMLKRFRSEVSLVCKDQIVSATRRWFSKQVAALAVENLSPEATANRVKVAASKSSGSNKKLATEPFDGLKPHELEGWSEAKWESVTLESLWHACVDGTTIAALDNVGWKVPLRHRDLLRVTVGQDSDLWVNERLIAFCAAFLDQGLSAWQLPNREIGFAKCFAKLQGGRSFSSPEWMRGLNKSLQEVERDDFDPLASIASTLQHLGVPESNQEQYIVQTLLSLRGWAGMINQLEHNAPWLPAPAARGTLHEFLAIRLLLDLQATKYLVAKYFGDHHSLATEELGKSVRARQSVSPIDEKRSQLACTVFQLAQYCGWTPPQLRAMSPQQWTCLVQEIQAFPSEQRRRLFHLAYECRYRNAALEAISTHANRRTQDTKPRSDKPAYLTVFCIDDREESFRRHLEEVDSECETASAAGFFAVAMYYQGADHAHYRPLCPNAITPDHYVREEPLFSAVDTNQRRALHRRHLGQITHGVHAGSRTMVGGWFTALFGAVTTLPLVTRILAPRLTARFRESAGAWIKPAATELLIERTDQQPSAKSASGLGYSLDEMAAIVKRILEDIGQIKNFPPLIVFFGHGSSSLNNPHESAYNCGACSGGRGGPNARAFAMMANDPRVRKLLDTQGLTIPVDVHFLGAYHNTCNDRVDYYDLDLVPRSHRELFRRIEASVNRARERNAHERSRKFESADLNLSPREALDHVEQRAEDLSQARPEYNHATNAMVLVGRRDWSRGLFLDRRAFLTSYDPTVDDDSATILARILQAAIPVCAGISLEYYFSTVDNEGYGCGSKLPHNVTSMIGVMTGATSDLRPGLSAQMVEIHEPMRILFVIETTPEKMLGIIEQNTTIAELVRGEWVQLAVIDSLTNRVQRFVDGKFVAFNSAFQNLAEVDSSQEWYRGQRSHLGFASIREAEPQRFAVGSFEAGRQGNATSASASSHPSSGNSASSNSATSNADRSAADVVATKRPGGSQ